MIMEKVTKEQSQLFDRFLLYLFGAIVFGVLAFDPNFNAIFSRYHVFIPIGLTWAATTLLIKTIFGFLEYQGIAEMSINTKIWTFFFGFLIFVIDSKLVRFGDLNFGIGLAFGTECLSLLFKKYSSSK